MKKSFNWMLLVLVALTSTAGVSTAQSVDSVAAITISAQHQYSTWNIGPDSSGFVEQQISEEADFSSILAVNPTFQTTSTGQLDYNFTGLNSGTTYYHRLMQSSATLGTVYSPIVAATTDTLFTMPTVSIDSLSDITTTSVTVNNSVSTGGDTLHLKVTTSTDPGFGGGLTWVDVTLPIGTTVAPVTITGLTPNINYWVKSEVTNRVGTIMCGSIFPFTTLDAGVYCIPSSDSSTVTDTTITMYGSANVATAYWFIHSNDYFSIAVLHAGAVEDYTPWGGGSVTANTTFASAPLTTEYWCFVAQYGGNTYYGNTLSVTTLPIDTPAISLTIPIVGDTSATAFGSVFSNEHGVLFVMYGQPTLVVGTQYSADIPLALGISSPTFDLHNLLAGTSGQAVLCAVVHGDTVISPIVSFVTNPSGAVIAFSGYVTSVNVDSSFASETVHFAFISENDLATVWVDIADSSDEGFIYPYPGGLPYTFQSYGGTAYDTIPVTATLVVNHAYRCRISGYNSANGTIYTSGSFLFNTYQDGTIGSFYSTPYVPIDYGDNATLHWSTSNASSVTISGIGLVANNGSISTGPLTETTTFTLTVNGLSGNVVSEEVTVEVTPTAVEVIDLVPALTIIFNEQSAMEIQTPIGSEMFVYSLNGSKIFESKISSEISRFDLKEPAGMYIATFVDPNGGMISRKLVLAP